MPLNCESTPSAGGAPPRTEFDEQIEAATEPEPSDEDPYEEPHADPNEEAYAEDELEEGDEVDEDEAEEEFEDGEEAEEAYADPDTVRSAPHRSTIHQVDHSWLDDPEQWAVTWRAYLRKNGRHIGVSE